MRRSWVLSASALSLLATMQVSAQSPDTSFAVEVILAKKPPPDRPVVVRCLEGCDWQEKAIECSAQYSDCRAVVTSSDAFKSSDNSKRPPRAARPIAETACLGIQPFTDPRAKRVISHCEDQDDSATCETEEVPELNSHVILNDIQTGSPAEQAGFKPVDTLMSLNSVPIATVSQLSRFMNGLGAGQPFDAVLEREGQEVLVRGHLGIRMSDGSCAVADAKLLQAAVPARDFQAVPFQLAVDDPGPSVAFRCIEGCRFEFVAVSCGSQRCAVTVNQDDVTGVAESVAARRP